MFVLVWVYCQLKEVVVEVHVEEVLVLDGQNVVLQLNFLL